jgi:bifunctional non-homologous end joining protein LigD
MIAKTRGRQADPLATYRAKRDPRRTREPVPPPGPLPRGDDDTFVVQEHHARRLHWDVRLERDGVLVSWAVPKGLPMAPGERRLAVHTEDHPLEYAAFEGEIPKGEYGGGQVTIWDRGHYTAEKWSDDEVAVTFDGRQVQGRYVFVRTRRGSDSRDWIVLRRDPAPGDWSALPSDVAPMLATAGSLPPATQDEDWAYEMKWDGVRVLAHVEGGRARLLSRNGRDVSAAYPELRPAFTAFGSRTCLLDGEVVAFEAGRPSFAALQPRMHVSREADARRLAERSPVTYLVFDLLHLDGHDRMGLPYEERRKALERLFGEVRPGPRCAVPPWFPGHGAAALKASQEQGLEGVVAKRRESAYRPGARSRDWVKVKNIRAQEVVVGGWRTGQGRRGGTIGALLVGIPGPDGLEYAGRVGTGFTEEMLRHLEGLLRRRTRATSPFAGRLPAAETAQARWVRPDLVGEVAFTEWTRDGRLRHPRWRGLRPDKAASEVVRES